MRADEPPARLCTRLRPPMRLRYAPLGLLLLGCYSTGDGASPPLERVYFPVGMAISRDNDKLFVANSDFDLQYNAGSVQTVDLVRLRSFIPRECESDADCEESGRRCDTRGSAPTNLCVETSGSNRGDPCGGLGRETSGERVTVPGQCLPLDLSSPPDGGPPALLDAVGIGAFATDIQLRYRPESDEGRLFVPVRGEASLHYIDVDSDGMLDCGARGQDGSCDEQHRVGTDSAENARELRMPTEPYALAISPDAEAIAVTHQTEGSVSLFVQDLEHWEAGPELSFIHTDLPTGAIAIASAPQPAIVAVNRHQWRETSRKSALGTPDPSPPGFLVAYRNAPQLDLLRYYGDEQSSPARPFLELAGSVALTANSGGYDSRGIAYDDFDRRVCEANCPNTDPATMTNADSECLTTCAQIPVSVYVASRSPASLLVGATVADTWATPTRDLPRFSDVVPLPLGPSRVYVAQVVVEGGLLERRVFVVCFDSRRIAIYDPVRRRIDAWVTTGRGPHALAFDVVAPDPEHNEPGRALAYVAHFTDSYVSVVQLDRRKPRTYASVVLNVAEATSPRAQK